MVLNLTLLLSTRNSLPETNIFTVISVIQFNEQNKWISYNHLFLLGKRGMHFCDLGPKNSRNSRNFCDSIISGNICRIYFYDANTLEKFSGTYFCDWLLLGR